MDTGVIFRGDESTGHEVKNTCAYAVITLRMSGGLPSIPSYASIACIEITLILLYLTVIYHYI
jgi:hypothetical protein